MLKCTNQVFDIVIVSETRIIKKASLTSNVNLQNYSFEFTPTEQSAGGALLYIVNHLSYKPRTDLNSNKANRLESTSIEIINSRKCNIIVGYLDKHHNMDVFEFNKIILTPLDKLSEEDKLVFLLDDFNISLLNYNDYQPTNEFLDYVAFNSFIPYTLEPTRITSNSETLIENIFSNIIFHEMISVNINATISDHLPKFCLLLIQFPRHHAKNPISMKGIGKDLLKQTLHLTFWIKIGLAFSN